MGFPKHFDGMLIEMYQDAIGIDGGGGWGSGKIWLCFLLWVGFPRQE